MQSSGQYTPSPYVKIKHPAWCKNASIYQINTRQFTPEGTFESAEQHLPRLKDLGVDILWLMPVHEIGVKNRKGSLGSPYSVRDYYSVNREFGSVEDLKRFVDAAHTLGLHVILDWVANHTAWDNPLVEEHPDWYMRDWKGDFRPTPWWDWVDIIELDYKNAAMRQYMTEAMKYWVREADIDGFRCDVAGFVPTDFWNTVRRELDAIKPVFMLAEWEARDLHAEAFDMTYAWTWFNELHEIVSGKKDLSALFVYYSWNEKAFSPDSFRMLFITNHDKNAWDGTEYEQFGAGVQTALALSVISEGMPLIYNGQEAGNDRRLAFFEKDTIEWKEHPHGALYKELLALKKSNTALWNGGWGATMIHIPNTVPGYVLSFVRQNEVDKVFAVFNFSGNTHSVQFTDGPYQGEYVEVITGTKMKFTPSVPLKLEPWDWKVYVKA